MVSSEWPISLAMRDCSENVGEIVLADCWLDEGLRFKSAQLEKKKKKNPATLPDLS